ncbi:electron transport complex subunit E [Thiomicrospira sp. WB1]|uniref:electron transport complex subunit E n=1 Tax=Thiomicrospira sp. WB1 TaxID=1685380 RepID=UPI000746105D|nr:electron transport complex subunit E [Thiomicrospira sp. WB1]KUJ72184.1 electron transport complex RsxE subunit [Thiomicrospira sp. WB1]
MSNADKTSTWQTYKKIIEDGLWHNNQALVALLGLCPLLAVTNNTVNGLGLGLATMAVVIISNVLVSLIRDYVSSEIRIPVFIAIIAAAVTVIDLMMEAYLNTLHGILGIFIPLIVTNCAILGRAEAFASRNPVNHALIDGFFVGLGFALVLIVLGALRELIGNGTLFDQMHLLLGDMAAGWTLTLPDFYQPVLLAILPPGAFIGLGLLIAIKNAIEIKKREKQTNQLGIQVQTEPTLNQTVKQ